MEIWSEYKGRTIDRDGFAGVGNALCRLRRQNTNGAAKSGSRLGFAYAKSAVTERSRRVGGARQRDRRFYGAGGGQNHGHGAAGRRARRRDSQARTIACTTGSAGIIGPAQRSKSGFPRSKRGGASSDESLGRSAGAGRGRTENL